MTTTTQILFNSPALHSLRRDQLVKLCKVHSLKASGKNKELIERLQLHAKTLPPDDPLSIATRSNDAGFATDSENEASDHSGEGLASVANNVSRPSEQWEVVMDTIAEVDEETLRSNKGASDRQVSEFGTNTSKGSVASSLKAIATSLGLKRNMSNPIAVASSSSGLFGEELVRSSPALPASASTSGSEKPPVEPIPGQSSLQGLPAPSDARLSLSQAPTTTTIRLVSNSTTSPELLLSPPRLEPFATSFDLVSGTPGGAGSSSIPVWPFSPGGAAREALYPSIPKFQGFGDLHKRQSSQPAQYDSSDMDIDVDMPGGLAVLSIREPTPEKATAGARFNTGATPKSTDKPSAAPLDIFSPNPKLQDTSTRSRLGIPRSKPFVFGSPLPQHNMSNLQFRTAAQSVLDDMNKRLAEVGVEAVDANVLNNRRTATKELAERPESGGPIRAGDMFEKIHQKQFNKMDSITSHYAAKRGTQTTAPQPILSKKRKSSLVVKEKKSGAPTARHRPNGSRVASGTSVKMPSGDFGEEDEDDEIADRRLSKRPRVEPEQSDASAQPDGTSLVPLPDPEEEVQKQKEREAIRRRLEHNKAKRRSSMGRPSLGRAPPPKPARFGLLASAKSLVQNVWNRGAGSKVPPNIPVSKPVQLKSEAKPLAKIMEAKKSAVIPGSFGTPPLSSHAKRTPSGGDDASGPSNVLGRSALTVPTVSGASGGSAGSGRMRKSPAPSLNPSGSSVPVIPRSLTIAGHGQSNRRVDWLVGFSSLGRKAGPLAHNGRVASIEVKSDIGTSAAGLQKQATGIPRSRTSSTLMAPTASSLAKTNSHSRVPVSTSSDNENSTLAKPSTISKQRLGMSPQPSATLEQITNSPRGPAHSPRPAKILSQRLSPPSTRLPMSLTSAATAIVGRAATEKSSSSKPSNAKVLPGRRPRISRSKVIAKLASQRAAGAGSGANAGIERAGGKVRSSMSAEVAGKARQSYGGRRGGDVMMSAKKRVRQSEQARRNRTGMGRPMDVD